jgi:outer membrane protein OmpA-like peptidoglycan-associated protein
MDDDSNENGGLVAWVIGLAVTLALAVAVFAGSAAFQIGPGTAASTSTSATGTARSATGTAAPSAGTAGSTTGTAASAAAPAAGASFTAPGTAIAAAPLLARVLFNTGVSALPADAAKTLSPAIEAATRSAGIRLAVSGYHDKTGDPEKNAELAKERAIAVRDALVAAGVSLERVELRKPQLTEGGTDDTLARRVDITGE